MTLIEYSVLLGTLDRVNLTKNGSPDFDKIAEITGLTRDSVKTLIAPKAAMPRWLKLLTYVAEERTKADERAADLLDEVDVKAMCGDAVGDTTDSLRKLLRI